MRMPTCLLFFLLGECITHVVSHFRYKKRDTNGHLVLDVDGDIKLGALFPIHKREEGSGNSDPCGEIQKEDGIQPLEALLFALDEINANPNILPGISLGVKAIDSCDDPYYATERSFDLIRGFISRHANLSCPRQSASAGKGSAKWPCQDNIVGLIGPQTTTVSVEVASLGRLFHVPQVSYLATSVALCSREKFPYFYRTVPSDKHQARAIVELLDAFNWTYASIVHSDSDYGLAGYAALARHVSKHERLCLADPITILNKHFTDQDYVNVIRKLLENKLSHVVIVFADRVSAGKLLEAAKFMGTKGKFLWIGSDAWASRESVVEDREDIVEGAIAIQPLRKELPGYDDYFTDLIKKHNERNPWFEEYLNHYHNCTNHQSGGDGWASCSQSEKFGPEYKYPQQLYIHFVRDAVYAFAHALDKLHRNSCPTEEGLCDNFKERVFEDLKNYLQDVNFPDVDGQPFEFFGHAKHDGPPRYSIINFQKNTEGQRRRAGTPKYDWQNVATLHYDQFTEWDADFRRRLLSDSTITRCRRKPCGPSEVKVQDTEDACCWHCRVCTDSEFKASDYECRRCPLGTRSDGGNRTGCVLIPETYLDYDNPWALASIAFSLTGIGLTMITCCIFWRYWDTPVVKACGRELSIMLLLGTFFSYATTFAIVSRPTPHRCGLLRFSVGFCYTFCYAAVVTKINRVARIFSIPEAGRSPRFTGPISSLIIASFLVMVEVVINVFWLMFEPPDVTHLYKMAGERILVCKGVNTSFVTGLLYPFFLIICATLYAFKTRKCPGGFNETRFIFLANIINTIHWVIYVPLYFASTDPEIRAVILAFSLSLSATVQLSCLLFPRVYTVIFKPEKNTRGGVMHNKHRGGVGRDFSVPLTPPNSVANPQATPSLSVPDSGFRTQTSVVSAPPDGEVAARGFVQNSHYSMTALALSDKHPQLELDKTSLPSSFARMSWTFHSSQIQQGEDGLGGRGDSVSRDTGPQGRHRSSSVCRGTQTTPSAKERTRERRITFTVSAPSDEDDEFFGVPLEDSEDEEEK